VPRLCGFYPGICLTTEEKSRKNLSQGGHTYTYNNDNDLENLCVVVVSLIDVLL